MRRAKDLKIIIAWSRDAKFHEKVVVPRDGAEAIIGKKSRFRRDYIVST